MVLPYKWGKLRELNCAYSVKYFQTEYPSAFITFGTGDKTVIGTMLTYDRCQRETKSTNSNCIS